MKKTKRKYDEEFKKNAVKLTPTILPTGIKRRLSREDFWRKARK